MQKKGRDNSFRSFFVFKIVLDEVKVEFMLVSMCFDILQLGIQ